MKRRMHSRSLLALLALLLLAGLLLAGLPWMTGRIAAQRMEHPVMETVTPFPIYDEYAVYDGDEA